MGIANSKRQWVAPPGGGGARAMLRHAGSAAQRRCQSKPAYAEVRGFALTAIYGVPQRLLSMYPPTVYSAEQAAADIEACRAGRQLPHHRRVVRYDKVSGGQDARIYALTTYHGYRARDFENPRTLQLLPYSEKDAQIDISAFQKTGKPYYRVIKQTSVVYDPKRGTARDWRDRGFDNRYRYSVHDSGQKLRLLGDRTGKRLDVSKYPRIQSGGKWVRLVPCSAMPEMCRPGDKVFPYIDDGRAGGKRGGRGAGGGGQAAAREAQNRKKRERRQQVAHSKKMDQLTRKMQGLNRSDPKYQELARRKKSLANSFRKGRLGGS